MPRPARQSMPRAVETPPAKRRENKPQPKRRRLSLSALTPRKTQSPRVAPEPHSPQVATTGPLNPTASDTGEQPTPSTPRNVPAAIIVGLLMGGGFVASLFIFKEAFVVLTAVAIVIAVWEISNAFRARRIRVPIIPGVIGALGMLFAAYAAGQDALLVALALAGGAVVWWRILDTSEAISGADDGDTIRDITAGLFTLAYVPFLAGFAVVMLTDPAGEMRVLTFVTVTIASDVGGYLVGSVWGSRLVAPSISPRKSWEGVAGSVVLAAVTGAFGVIVLLGGEWWVGLLLGVAVTVAATVGDFSESLLKRDLGMKDMGSLLPGHGGVMDRLDSLLPAAPVAYLVLTLCVTGG